MMTMYSLSSLNVGCAMRTTQRHGAHSAPYQSQS
jgi:hypothetical protein